MTITKPSALLLACLLPALNGCVGSSSPDSVDVRLGETPVAYVQRVIPREDDESITPQDIGENTAFFPGARLLLRDVASPSAPERDLLAGMFDAPVDIKDLGASPDGSRLLFALREPEIEDADEDEQPTWNIWEYDVANRALRRIIGNDLIAEEGQDMAPQYLPDGRILFISTRQRQARARLLDEGRPQFAPLDETIQNFSVALHVMNPDGTDIRQITFNPGSDFAPLVMEDGRVMFLRWDNKDTQDEFNLYAVRPDGLDAGILYGGDSHVGGDPAPVRWRPALLGDGDVLVMRRPRESATWSAVPYRLRVADFINEGQPLVVTGGDAETPLLPGVPVYADDRVSPGGRFAALTPLGDGTGRFLAAWSPCRLRTELNPAPLPCTDENLENANLLEADPAYGLWILDTVAGTRRPVVAPRADTMITDVAVLSPRTAAPLITDARPGVELDQVLYDSQLGILDIRSVYDFAGVFDPQVTLPGITTLEDFRDPAQVTAEDRRVRFLRITKGVLIPDDDVVELDGTDFGRQVFGMREIVGYVPVAPDGSVRARVPANVPLGLQIVDAAGRNVLGRHGGWISVSPGETLVCGGCHEAGSPLPHGRRDADLPSANPGAPATGVPFPNTRPALFADAGETMAQVLGRLEPGIETPSLDLVFDDVWTDPDVRAPDASWAIRYTGLATASPEDPLCVGGWNTLCRAVIHYGEHIQPLWDLPRTADVGGVMTDVTCTGCHSRRDAMNALRVPEAQLELTGEDSGEVAGNAVSYRDLLFQDNQVELVDGALVDALVQDVDDLGNPLFEVDENGDPVLDDMGNPVPVMVPVAITPPMVAGSARVSRFFGLFDAGGAHEGWLSAAELKLLAEWLDVGAQNYNDPFAVPQ